jgi:hypothetical protein
MNLEIPGYNRFFAFLSALDLTDEKPGGCTNDTLLAFSEFKMATEMTTKYGTPHKLIIFQCNIRF